MENPSVNPITGFGRTAAQRARELAAFRRAAREESTSLIPSVFQGDFLFVQLPRGDVQLHRVAHGACIEDANSPGTR